MDKLVKAVAGLGCAFFVVCFMAGVFQGIMEIREEAREEELVAQTEDLLREKLRSIQNLSDEIDLGDDFEPTRRIKESETFFVDMQGFKKYSSVLNGKDEFDYDEDILINSMDEAVKSLITREHF